MTLGAGRTITPSAFNMVRSIVEDTTTINLSYNDGHDRIQQTAPSGTTAYLDDPVSGAMSEAVVSGGSTTWHDYLRIDGHLIAARNCTGAAPCSTGATMSYFSLDNLDSVAAITNDAGVVVERDAYDPWGLRRNLNGTDDPTCGLTSLTTRGFTGHEHMPAVCEINANARVYDPTIGRFLSADTVVSDPLDGQAFNRYSYIDNRPLSGTDPSGHVPCYGCTRVCYGNCGPGAVLNFTALMDAIKAGDLPTLQQLVESDIASGERFTPGQIDALLGVASISGGSGYGSGTSVAQVGSGSTALTGPNVQSSGNALQGSGGNNSGIETIVVTGKRYKDEQLSSPIGKPVTAYGGSWQEYAPSAQGDSRVGSDADHYRFYGPAKVRIVVASANIHIIASYDGQYTAYAVDENGYVATYAMSTGDSMSRDISSLILPMATIDRIYIANLRSSTGIYYWDISIGSRRDPTADNDQPLFVSVFGQVGR
jgi:RHS repeat-associated protein